MFLTVGELSELIEQDLRADRRLRGVWVKGEVSNLRDYAKAWYFDLKDEEALVNAVIWKYGATKGLGESLKEGTEVLARGDVTTYKARSVYQLRVVEVQATDKRGALFLKFEKTKKALEAEGLFAQELKRPLPEFPSTVGVVTSAEGSVLRDIIHVVTRRFPHVRLLLAPARVQGEGAEHEVVAGIEALNRFGGVDVIIVARGGGSIEDLWPFNEEVVARAVRSSAVPVVSAVGHQTDFTICDFAADVRAPTPSAAAEIVVPSAEDIVAELGAFEDRLRRGLVHTHEVARQRFERLARHALLRQPQTMLESRLQRLDEVSGRLHTTAAHTVERARARVERHAAALDVLSPLRTLARGYAIAVRGDGRVVRATADVGVGDDVDVLLGDGALATEVKSKRAGRLGRAGDT
jgi:exodeoxyribonuclease VII large subunit